MKKILLALSASLGLVLPSNDASAAALSYPGALRDALPSSKVEKVHWRGYVHCHIADYGRRFCHGGPGWGPPAYRFGPSYRRDWDRGGGRDWDRRGGGDWDRRGGGDWDRRGGRGGRD